MTNINTTAFTLPNVIASVSTGAIFSVTFIKRSTGQQRTMVCRTGVHSHLKGGKPTYNATDKGLLPVYDMHSKGYRSIPVDAIQSMTVHGQTFTA